MSDNINDGNTPLMLAADGGYTKVCSLMLDRAADPGEKEEDGFTSLIAAAENGHLKTCKLLLDHDADIGDKNNILV